MKRRSSKKNKWGTGLPDFFSRFLEMAESAIEAVSGFISGISLPF